MFGIAIHSVFYLAFKRRCSFTFNISTFHCSVCRVFVLYVPVHHKQINATNKM